MIIWVGNLLLLASASLATAFVVLYAFTARWWGSQMGRNIMWLMLVIAVLLTLSVIRVFLPVTADVLWFGILRLVVFAFVPVVLAQRLWLLIKVQVLRRSDRQEAARVAGVEFVADEDRTGGGV